MSKEEYLEKEKKEEEIPDTWIDVFAYPAGVFVGALLAAITYIISR